jgi:hypothetical protein
MIVVYRTYARFSNVESIVKNTLRFSAELFYCAQCNTTETPLHEKNIHLQKIFIRIEFIKQRNEDEANS